MLREGSTDVDVAGGCCACPNEAWLLSSTRGMSYCWPNTKGKAFLGCRGGLVVLRLTGRGVTRTSVLKLKCMENNAFVLSI